MTSQRRFFSGDSLTQALNQAAQHFQLPVAEIDYKAVEKRHGFLKVRRKVVISVDESSPRRLPDEPEVAARAEPEASALEAPTSRGTEPERTDRAEPPAAAEPEEEASEPPAETERVSEVRAEQAESEGQPEDAAEDDQPGRPKRRRGRRGRRDNSRRVELAEAPLAAKARFPEATGEEAEAAAKALERILGLAGLVVESEILQAEEHLQIELRGADQDLLLRDRGRLLLAVQHLLPRVVRGLIGRSVLCRVDSDNYHEIREERLRDMAQRAADEVRHKGRPKTLEPMSPDERRIVHLTLADYPGVETESHGSGLFKRVMVRSVREDRPGGVDSYRR